MTIGEFDQLKKRIQQASHIAPLLNRHELVVVFSMAGVKQWLHVQKGTVNILLQEPEAMTTTLEIIGDTGGITRVINGELPLRKMAANGTISAKGRLRDILWLESVLLLVKPIKTFT